MSLLSFHANRMRHNHTTNTKPIVMLIDDDEALLKLFAHFIIVFSYSLCECTRKKQQQTCVR